MVFIAGLIKVCVNKRRYVASSMQFSCLADISRTERKRIEEASRPADKEKLVQKELNEGNLFGVRAIQNGYYGGVSQSRSNSPSPSYRLAPETTLVDWGKEGNKAGSSASSISSVPKARMKQSPLRLELQDAKYNPSSVGGIGGSYIPPSSPSIRSYRMDSPNPSDLKPAGWISPLDVHFSRPSTPGTPTTPSGRFATFSRPTTPGRPTTAGTGTPAKRPTSYLKLNLDIGKPVTLMPPAVEAKSEVASVVSSGLTTPTPAMLKTPTQPMPSTARSAQKTPTQSYFPTDNQPSVRFLTPSVPLKDLPSPKAVGDPARFPSDHQHWRPSSPDPSTVVVKARWRNALPTKDAATSPTGRQWIVESPTNDVPPSPILGKPTLPLLNDADLEAQWDRSRPVIRNSAASRRVSIVKPELTSQTTPNANLNVFQSHERIHNAAAFKIPESIAPISSSVNRAIPTRMSSQTASIVLASSTTTSSGESTPQATPHHDRNISEESYVLGNEYSHSPERTSPFSNSHATSASDASHSHSNNSSFSSYLSTTSSPTRSLTNTNKSQTSLIDLENFPFPASPRAPPQMPGFEFTLPAAPSLGKGTGNNLQVHKHMSGQSRVSMGDFYDSYYADMSDIPVPAPLSPSQDRFAALREQSHFSVSPGSSRPSPNHSRTPGESPMRNIGFAHSPDSSPTKGRGYTPSPNASPTKNKNVRREAPRRPAPLNLSKLGSSHGWNGGEEVEASTPRTGAFGGGPVIGERFPTRI